MDDGERGAEPRPIWSEELRTAYLELLRATGNARASARIVGHPTLFEGRRARDPVFRRECREAVAEADARLRQVSGAFPAPDGLDTAARSSRGPEEAREPVIRRTSNGRLQISYVREGDMTSADEAAFLEFLRTTGNFEASAAAIGLHPCTLYRRIHRWPDFAQRCEQARGEAEIALDYRLAAHAHALTRRPGEARLEGEDKVPFDPQAAIRILQFLERRRAGRLAGRPRKGPPERSFEEAVESILAKVEAIRRHRQMMKERAEREGDGSSLSGGEGS